MGLPVDGAPVLRHGDFSPDQVVVDAGRAGLLDLDEAVLGDPVADLGTFCAALARDDRSADRWTTTAPPPRPTHSSRATPSRPAPSMTPP